MWQVEDGLPQNSVTSIAQTRDGYLWLGTYGGLARFDGVRFKTFTALDNPKLEDDDIVSLYEDARGALWIGHESGVLTCYRNGRFENMVGGAVSIRRKVVAINADSDGNIWALHDGGALQAASDGRVLPKRNPYAAGPLEFVRDTAGELYVNRDGRVSLLRKGKLESIDFGPAKSSGYVEGFAASADGGLWIVRDSRLKEWKHGRWVEDRGPCQLGQNSISAMIEMAGGCVAVGTNENGFYLFYPSGQARHFGQGDGLPENWVRSLCQDREGDLWIGVGTSGIVMMKPALFTVTNSPDHWQGDTVLSVAPGKDGTLWIGSEGGGLYRLRNGQWSHFGREQGLQSGYVWSVAEDSEGHVYAGTWGGGLYELAGDRCIPVPGLDAGSAPVLALDCTPDDNGFWAGIGNGLVHWRKGAATWVYKAPAGATDNISTVVRDRTGAIWFGITGGGLGRLVGGEISVFRRKDGMASDRVNCLLPEADGTFWIGTADAGLCRMKDGRFATISEKQGLASNVICHIADDGLGFLWVSTHRGILRFSKDDLNSCADGRTHDVAGRVYGRDDGLPTLEFSGGLKAAGCQTTDGRLWFTCSKGLVSVNPARVRPNRNPPPVLLESLQVDSRTFDNAGGALNGIRLAPNHLRLEFKFTALSFAAPSRVRFKYRLLGLDKNWVDSGNRRSAFYSQLAPGRYRFQCIASNGYGVWSANRAQMEFTVLPFYWQTWWFLSLSGLFAFLVVAWVIRYDTRRKLRSRFARLEQERAIERERARIARDIHDDIGASLTRITLLSQSAPGGSGQPPEVAGILREIFGTAREVTESLDEIVWAINPRHDTLESLICYMAKYAQDFLSAAHVRCRLELPVKVPEWALSTHARHNLFLAFKEVINNAVKHSGASEVRLSLKIEADAFALAISDNGRGIPVASMPDDATGPGNGLFNLQHRLAQIGGRCEVASNAGAGTTVLFVIASHRLANEGPRPRVPQL